MDAMKIKGSWLRNHTAKALRDVRKLLTRSETIEDNEFAHPEESPFWAKALFTVFIVCVCLIGGCRLCGASESISTYRAVNAIIGEAENQGYQGMLAVAHAIRNRGTLKGVYGERAPRVVQRKFSEKTYQLALKAWCESQLTEDFTHGATHWENIKAFGCPSWVKECVETFRYKDHVFYKEVGA